MYPVIVNGIRASDPRGLNKGRGSKFRVGSQVRQETPEEGWKTYRPKRCEYNNKGEDCNPKPLNDKNHQALSQKFTQLIPGMGEIRGGGLTFPEGINLKMNVIERVEFELAYFEAAVPHLNVCVW